MPTNCDSARSLSELAPSWTALTKRIAPIGISATMPVLIERTSVWLTARFAASAYGLAVLPHLVGVLPDLVEDHDGVVEREAEDREQTGDRGRA